MFTQAVLWVVGSWHQTCVHPTWLEIVSFENVVGLIAVTFSPCLSLAFHMAIYMSTLVEGSKLLKFTKPPATQANSVQS